MWVAEKGDAARPSSFQKNVSLLNMSCKPKPGEITEW